jgi:hypothetical protein
MNFLEECERLQGIEKEAKGSTHNIRQVRNVKVKPVSKKSRKKYERRKQKENQNKDDN